MNERAFLFTEEHAAKRPLLIDVEDLDRQALFAAERESSGIHHLEIVPQRLVEGDFVIHRGCRILFRISRIDAVNLGGLENDVGTHFRAAQRCRRAGKRLYLLSNYPREGYLRMREKFADRFGELFDGGVISYACHLVKPEKAIYEKLIADCGLDPAHTLFIDDTLPNVEAAMKMGINGFHMHEKGMMDRFFL